MGRLPRTDTNGGTDEEGATARMRVAQGKRDAAHENFEYRGSRLKVSATEDASLFHAAFGKREGEARAARRWMWRSISSVENSKPNSIGSKGLFSCLAER